MAIEKNASKWTVKANNHKTRFRMRRNRTKQKTSPSRVDWSGMFVRFFINCKFRLLLFYRRSRFELLQMKWFFQTIFCGAFFRFIFTMFHIYSNSVVLCLPSTTFFQQAADERFMLWLLEKRQRNETWWKISDLSSTLTWRWRKKRSNVGKSD